MAQTSTSRCARRVTELIAAGSALRGSRISCRWRSSAAATRSVTTTPPPSEPDGLEVSPRPVSSSSQSRYRNTDRHQYLESLMDRAGELSLRCSILDAEGNWTAEEGRYKKAKLCAEHDLDPRDLRKLDSLHPNLVPTILSRRTAILINCLHIRALIKADRVILFDSAGTKESEIQGRFRWHLEGNVVRGLSPNSDGGEDQPGGGLVYEHRALESVLVSVANALEEEMAYTRQLVTALLADLEDNINRENLKRLLHYSRRLVGFQSRARYVHQAIEELLESDEDLSAMYLTARKLGKPRGLHDHEQLELLLESFSKQVEEIVSEVDSTVANMQSTQEITELMLDSNRNALLALGLKVSIATLGLGTGALVAGLFGMNLTSHLEASPAAFYVVSGSVTALAILVFVYGLRVLRRVRRVGLARSSIQPSTSVAVGENSHLDAYMARRIVQDDNAPHKWSIWSAIFKRQAKREAALKPPVAAPLTPGPTGGSTEPVWINEKADLARARDAARHVEMLKAKEAASQRGGREGNRWKPAQSPPLSVRRMWSRE